MAGKATWDNTDLLVTPQKQKEIYQKAQFPTLVGKITGDGEVIKMQNGGREAEIDLPGTSIIRTKSITTGNEIVLTMEDDPTGMAGSYGDAAARTGNFLSYKHAKGWVNQIDSEATPLPGRCNSKMVNDIINDPKNRALKGRMNWAATEMDDEFIRSFLMGASRNILSDKANGGLYEKLYNCGTGGLTRSCYNFYVPGTGFVSQSAVQATYETAVGTALATLSDNANYAFDMGETAIIEAAIASLRFKPVTIGGKVYRAAVFCDPDLLWRLTSSNSAYETLMKEAAARGMDNPAINKMGAIVLNEIIYIPYYRLKAYRPSVVGGVPVYGAGMNYDPRTYITTNTSKICLSLVCGADAVLRGGDKTMWPTVMTSRDGKSTEVFVSWDDGFTRIEHGTFDARTATLENTASAVLAHYDPGVNKAFAA